MKSTSDQIELALERKEHSLKRVLENATEDWKALARRVVRTMRGREVTGEDIRLRCLELDIAPHHHNAWGALVSSLVKQGWLVPTGRWVPMRGEKSNARQTQTYLVRSDI